MSERRAPLSRNTLWTPDKTFAAQDSWTVIPTEDFREARDLIAALQARVETLEEVLREIRGRFPILWGEEPIERTHPRSFTVAEIKRMDDALAPPRAGG